MVRRYVRDAKGRFARVGERRKFKRTAKKTYRQEVAKSRAQLNRDNEAISRMSDSEYNRHVRKGTYAGSKVFGQDLASATYDSHSNRKSIAKAKYKATISGSKVRK